MKITVIGPGAMGLLFGGKLAACADVSLIGSNPKNLKEINENGVTIKRGDSSVTRKIPAYQGGSCSEPVDVVMLFTKAYQIRDVLSENRGLIGPDTLLLTLQNGAGHERVMREFADSRPNREARGRAPLSSSTADSERLCSEAPPLKVNRDRIRKGWRNFALYLREQVSPAQSAIISGSRSGTN